jgi:hypothetical protein
MLRLVVFISPPLGPSRLINESISASIHLKNFIFSTTVTTVYFSHFFLDRKPAGFYILFHDAHLMVLGGTNSLFNKGEVGYQEL